MWLRHGHESFAMWPCDDVLDNITIYTSMLSLLWAHWVVSCFLGDAYCRLKLDNEGLTILHRFVVHAPSFKFLQRYNDIIDGQINAGICPKGFHKEQDIHLRWTVAKGVNEEFKPPFQFTLTGSVEEVHF